MVCNGNEAISLTVKKEELIRNYAKAIREGNAAIFGGAGLSRPSGFVDWKGLLRPLASDIGLDVDKETDMLSVAQFYKNQRGTRSGINQAILDAFSKDAQINENIRIISRLPIFTYWTTNYDELLEKGVQEANRNPDVKSESDQFSNVKHDRDAIVYKMHGDVKNPAKAVLTKDDYELYEHHRPLFRTALKSDLVSKVFLFIGFSFKDPNLDYILSQIRSLLGENIPNHYCFFKRVQKNEFNDSEEFKYCLTRQDMQEENLRNYGIQTVFVNSYAEITDILKEIERVSKLHNIFISGSACEYTVPWNKQQAEALASKLAGALVHEGYRISSGFGLGLGSAIVNGALDIIYSEKYGHIDKHLCLRPFPQNISDPNDRAKRWKEYRESIIDETGISIFLFGNKNDSITGNTDTAEGCFQEYEIAKAKGNIVVPIGSTGYAAKSISDTIRCNISDYPYLADVIGRLETETNIESIVKLVMEVIKKQQN